MNWNELDEDYLDEADMSDLGELPTATDDEPKMNEDDEALASIKQEIADDLTDAILSAMDSVYGAGGNDDVDKALADVGPIDEEPEALPKEDGGDDTDMDMDEDDDIPDFTSETAPDEDIPGVEDDDEDDDHEKDPPDMDEEEDMPDFASDDMDEDGDEDELSDQEEEEIIAEVPSLLSRIAELEKTVGMNEEGEDDEELDEEFGSLFEDDDPGADPGEIPGVGEPAGGSTAGEVPAGGYIGPDSVDEEAINMVKGDAMLAEADDFEDAMYEEELEGILEPPPMDMDGFNPTGADVKLDLSEDEIPVGGYEAPDDAVQPSEVSQGPDFTIDDRFSVDEEELDGVQQPPPMDMDGFNPTGADVEMNLSDASESMDADGDCNDMVDEDYNEEEDEMGI